MVLIQELKATILEYLKTEKKDVYRKVKFE